MPSIALNNGVFQITDDGDTLDLVTNLRRERPWSPGRNDEVLGVRVEGDDYVILIATTRRDVTSYSELRIADTGLVDRRATDLTLADVGDVQGEYSFIDGRAPNIAMGENSVAGASTPNGIVLYTQQGRFSIREASDTVGEGVRLVDSRGNEWEPPRDTVVIGARATEDGYALLLQTDGRRGTSFSELEFSAEGVAARRATSLTEAEKVALEGDYGFGEEAESDVQEDAQGLATDDGVDLDLVLKTFPTGEQQFVLRDDGDSETDQLLVDSRGNDWAPDAGFDPIALRVDGDGNPVVLFRVTDRRGEVSFSELRFTDGVADRRPTEVRESDAIANYDFADLEAPVNSPLTLDTPTADDLDVVRLDYTVTGQVQFVLRESGEADVVLTDNRGNDWAPGGRETLVAVRDNGDGFSVLLRNDTGRITEQAFDENGQAARTTTTFRDYDLVQQSILYNSDLTGQGFNQTNVDTVAEVLTAPDSVRDDAGQVWAVRSEGGAFFVQQGEAAPVVGGAVDRLLENDNDGDTVPLLIFDRSGAWSPSGAAAQGATPIGAREVSEDRFAVISVRESASGRETYTEQVIDATTGQTIGRERTVDPVELEGAYLQDFNGDGVIDIRGVEYVTALETLELNGETILADISQAAALGAVTGDGVLRLSGTVDAGDEFTLSDIGESVRVELGEIAPGAVITVREDSGNVILKGFATIQDAIDDSETTDGTDIFVGAGSYDNFTVEKDGLSFFADGAVTVTGPGTDTQSTSAVRIQSGTDDIHLEGFTFVAGNDLAAVYAVGANNNISLVGNTLQGGVTNAFVSGGTGGAGLTNSTFDGNTFVGTSAQALVSVGVDSDNNSFTDNTFTGAVNGGLLLEIENSSGTSTVTGNTFNGGASYAAIEVFGDRVDITGNTLDVDLPGGLLRLNGEYDTRNVLDANTAPDAVVLLSGQNALAFDTIQAAIDEANADDTILVGAGTYDEAITINKDGLTLLGPNAGIAGHDDARGPEAVLTGSGDNADLRVMAENVTIDGFQIAKDKPTGTPSFQVRGDDATIVNNVINSALYQTRSDLTYSNNLVTEFNATSGYALSAIASDGTGREFSGWEIKDNVFDGLDRGLTLASGGSGDTYKDIEITGNEFLNIANRAVQVGDNATIEGFFKVEDNLFTGDGDPNTSGDIGVAIRNPVVIDSGATITINENTFTDLYAGLWVGNQGELVDVRNNATGNTFENVAFEVRVRGTDDDDVLVGTSFDEVFIGRAGDDTFVFSGENIGNDVIADFVSGTDKIRFEGPEVSSVDDLLLDVQEGNKVISASEGQFEGSITLLGVSVLSLEEDFLFPPSETKEEFG